MPEQKHHVGKRLRMVRARFDNADTSDDNRRHWANADALSPDALGDEAKRKELAFRCRYEVRNNSWAKGIKDTLANDCIGTGPRLQLLTDDKGLNEDIERDFHEWADEIGLAEKLRTMRAARVESGEVFGLMGTNPALMSSVKMDLELAETEQVTDPTFSPDDSNRREGIEYDDFGNPIIYHVLKYHPGSTFFTTFAPEEDFRRWPARFVLHYYRPDRPGQSRGIPDLTPAIGQFAELRRYSMAVIRAAEAVADHALVLETDAPASPDDAAVTEIADFDTVELARGLATVLPQGRKLGQPKAEQPTDTYKDFVKTKLSEISRCLSVPLIFAGLDAADANMSSAYIVGQKYQRTILIDRADIERHLNRLLDMWLTEWLRANRTGTPERFDRAWQWDEVGDHADPQKVANATKTLIDIGATSLARVCARRGEDIEDIDKENARELGVTVEEYRELRRQKWLGKPQTAAPGTPETQPETSDEEVEEAAEE